MKRKTRMPLRAVAFAVPLLVLLSASPAAAAPAYNEELAVMQATVDSFNACAARIENAATADDMAPALSFAADELEKVFPAMIKVTKDHPDWGRNPPPEVRPTMEKFDAAYDRFLLKALKKATNFANDNSDNAALQKSFGRVNHILYKR